MHHPLRATPLFLLFAASLVLLGCDNGEDDNSDTDAFCEAGRAIEQATATIDSPESAVSTFSALSDTIDELVDAAPDEVTQDASAFRDHVEAAVRDGDFTAFENGTVDAITARMDSVCATADANAGASDGDAATEASCGTTLVEVGTIVAADNLTENETTDPARCNFTWDEGGPAGLDVAIVRGGRAAFSVPPGAEPIDGHGDDAYALVANGRASAVALVGDDVYAVDATGVAADTGLHLDVLDLALRSGD